ASCSHLAAMRANYALRLNCDSSLPPVPTRCLADKKETRSTGPRLTADQAVEFSSIAPQIRTWKMSRGTHLVADDDGTDVFLSLIPIFFRKGWIDCLRPRNFSMETVTSRESPRS